MLLIDHMTQDQWRDAGPFRLDLVFLEITEEGAWLKDSEGHEHRVFGSDFALMVPHMERGKISGEFKLQKRGPAYGLKLWGLR